MTKPFAQKIIEDRRLVLLRLLSEQRGGRANSSVLRMGLVHLGIVCDRHEVIDDLLHLQLHNLVALESATEDLYIAQLLERGDDLVNGLAEAPGISRPRRSR